MFALNFIITSISLVLQCCETVEAAKCGTNFPYNLSNGKCVFLSNEKASYCDALVREFFVLILCVVHQFFIWQRSCQQRNEELLTGESQLASFMKTLGPKQEFWIGLTLLYQSKSYKLLSTAAERRKSFRWTNNSFRNATTYWHPSKSFSSTFVQYRKSIWCLRLYQPDNTGAGYYAREYCVYITANVNQNILGDLSCNSPLNYICQPKIEMFISSKVFQLDDATVLEFTSGGCFSAAVKVQS